MNASKVVAIVRDVACLAAGLFGVIHQEITGHVSSQLLVVYTALMGVPGTTALVALWRGRPAPTDTTGGSSEPRER